MRIIHISKYHRFSSLGVHTGGVSKFAWYLKQAIPEIKLIAWNDFPDWQKHELNNQDWEKATLLNAWLLEEGIIGRDTIAIGDGFWLSGLEGKVNRLISVAHGSYAGAMVEHMKNPWDDGFLLGQSVRHQEKFWRESGCEIIAVSYNAARELKLLCGLDSTVIYNGIDLEIFTAQNGPPRREGLILEATGGHPAKGAKVIEELKGMGYYIEPFGIQDGNLEHEAARWSEAGIAIFPSHYEGNSYALLEAMACGCKVIGYWTGIIPQLPTDAMEYTDDHNPIALAHLLDIAQERQYRPIKANYKLFAKDWRAYLESPN